MDRRPLLPAGTTNVLTLSLALIVKTSQYWQVDFSTKADKSTNAYKSTSDLSLKHWKCWHQVLGCAGGPSQEQHVPSEFVSSSDHDTYFVVVLPAHQRRQAML